MPNYAPEQAEIGLPADLESGLAQKHLPALDGLRAVAVFLVIFYHAGISVAPGGLGVLIFFVLSGFLITWLMLVEADRYGSVSLRDFYARRSLRIFPAFYAYAACVLVILVVRHRQIVEGQLVAALLYFNNYYQALRGDPNTGFSHTWSLAVEEQFYLLWPAAFLLFGRNRRRLASVLCLVIAGIWIYRFLLVPHVSQGYIYEAFDTRADSLLCGCLLAIALREGFATGFFRIVCSNYAAAIASLALLAISVWLELRLGVDYRDRYGFALDSALAAILLCQAIAFRGRTLFRWLDLKPVRYLGGISYSLYLWQQLVIGAAEKPLARYGLMVTLPVVVAACVAMATLSWQLVERPALRLKKRFERTR